MGCQSSKKERMDQKIIEESSGLINRAQLDNIYMSYNFTQNEVLTLIDEYKKICINPNGLITLDNLMDFPPFHYSPFGYHILDALDLYDKTDFFEKLEEEKKKDKDDKLKIKKKEKEKEKEKSKKSKDKKDKKDKSKKDKKDKSKKDKSKKDKSKKDKSKKSKKDDDDDDDEGEIDIEELTKEDLISESPEENGNNNDGKKIGIQDFVYYVYLFSSHAKIVERAQLYFKLFDFDNDGKITPSDILIYLENLERDSDKVIKETKKYFNKERKINKDDYILELDKLKEANINKQIANLIIKEACTKGKNYIDFFDFRNMFLSMQFIPEYSCPLYLEEKFNDGRVGGGVIKKKEPSKNEENSINQNETQEVVIPVKVQTVNEKEKDDNEKIEKKEDEKTAQESKVLNSKKEKDDKQIELENEDEDEEEEEEEDDEEEEEKKENK